jgi:hypothetical protein
MQPLTDYERFVLDKAQQLLCRGSPALDPHTEDDAELAAARRIIAALQDARSFDIKGRRRLTLRQQWERSRH